MNLKTVKFHFSFPSLVTKSTFLEYMRETRNDFLSSFAGSMPFAREIL